MRPVEGRGLDVVIRELWSRAEPPATAKDGSKLFDLNTVGRVTGSAPLQDPPSPGVDRPPARIAGGN